MSRIQQAVKDQYALAEQRLHTPAGEKSYTAYLYAQGLDKILKKCGEETFEVCIAAKNKDLPETVGELNDVIYHVTVLLCYCGVSLDDVMADLNRRCQSDSGDLETLYEVIVCRAREDAEESYTAYLFRQGLDKILKKVGEACAQLIIAGKDRDCSRIGEYTGDLLFHLLTMMVCNEISISALADELDARAQKTGNLKQVHSSDHTT